MVIEMEGFRLEELGRIVTGKTPSSNVAHNFDSTGVPFVTPKDMDGRKWIDSTERYLSAVGIESLRSCLVPARSVAVSCIGSDMGKAILLESDSVTNQQINTIVVDQNRFNPEYIYYVLSMMQQELKSIASGSATPILNKGHFGKVTIDLPKKSYQDLVVKILDCLDDKMHLNNQINQTLESIAQAMFKSWFIDFDPVKAKIKAKLEGKDAELAAMCAISGKNEAELKQMTVDDFAELQATAALFPDELVGSELGEVPKGWGINNLGDIGKFNPGSAFNPEYQGQKVGEIPFIKVSDMNLEGNEVFITKANNYIHDDLQKKLKMKTHSQGSTVFAKIGVALISNRRRILTKPTLIDNNMMSIAAIDDYATPYYLYLLLRTIDFNILVSGTALPYLNVSDLRKILVIRPPKNYLDIFEAKVSPCFQQLNSNSIQNQTLSSLRNVLLPELLLGNLVVSDSGE